MLTLFAVGCAVWRFEDELDDAVATVAAGDAETDAMDEEPLGAAGAERSARRTLLRTAAVFYPAGALCIFAASFSASSIQAELAFGISYDCLVISAGVLVQVASLGCVGEVKWLRAVGLFVWFAVVFITDCPSSLILLTNTVVLAALLVFDITPRGGVLGPPPPPRVPRPWALWVLIVGVVLSAVAVLARFVGSVVALLSEAEMAYTPSPAPARAGR